MENNICIAFASDNHYVKTLSIALRSLLDTIKDDSNSYEIIILSDSVIEENKKRILEMNDVGDRVKIRMIEISDQLNQYDFKTTANRPSRGYYIRLLLPELLKDFDKVLYMDCDIIVRKSLSDLFHLDIDGFYVAACEDPILKFYRNETADSQKYFSEVLNLSLTDKYFNSGILLMNLKKFREDMPSSKLLLMASSRKYNWEDQDVLNIACKNKILWLSSAYNFIWSNNQYRQNQLLEDSDYSVFKNDPIIMHYAGVISPLDTKHSLFTNEYWNIVDKIPFKNEVLEEKKNKGFTDKLKDAVKYYSSPKMKGLLKKILK